ncbi:MAG: hypothetical protein DWP97_00270 [Calditrichaeota bacterium]|nr:MAG: hypothetical protein DWP97_00270 [Calditrichota bacterium]
MSIKSEFHPLKGVIIHKPGYEWNLVTVEHNMQEKYLIEDILFTEEAATDHTEFTDCLKHAVGTDSVLDFTTLLEEILSDREVRSDIVGAVSALENVGVKTHDLLLSEEFSNKELSNLLVAGAFHPEDKEHKGYKVLFTPIPNLMFTRDIGMFLHDAVILSHPAKVVRRREGLLARYIFRNHPLFKDINIIDIYDDATIHGMPDKIHLEGGDMLVLDKDTLLIGSSERTTDIAIELLMNRLFAEGIVKRVIKVLLPTDRATMHLDTVFTIIGKDDCVYYPRFFSNRDKNQQCPCFTYELVDGALRCVDESLEESIFGALKRIGYDFPNRIPCGGDIPHYQTREQWTDGANLFAVLPEVAFIYERNIQTINAFKKNGYSILTPKEFLKSDSMSLKKTIVTLSGAELSRGRGGARCMTMPFARNYE